MIEIVSLLLGLVTGLNAIELSVVGPVAQVEVELDGKSQGLLSGPPWTFECNFGQRLEPHRLVAIARDAEGRELDRAERLINVELESADAFLTLLPNEHGKPVALQISWESIGQVAPQSLQVFFDEQPLRVENPHHIPLPPYDLADFHLVTATLTFKNDTPHQLQAGFGGVLGAEIATELTAVAILRHKGRLPAAAQMEGWFEAEGKALKVHGAEKGKAEILLVRDPSIQPQLDALAWYLYDRRTSTRRTTEHTDPALAALVRGDQSHHAHVTTERKSVGRLRDFVQLGLKYQVRFVAPASAPLLSSGVQRGLFLQSPKISAHNTGLGRLALANAPQKFDIQLADAVALAGMLANSSQKRRAVLLLLGDSHTDASTYQAKDVRNYLQDLGVPFFVARFNGEQPDPTWGKVLDLGNLKQPADAERHFRRAFQTVTEQLEKQRLIWLFGRHLPQHIELGSAAQGIQLAGR